MPDQISVSEFIAETTADYNSPTASRFTARLHDCRNTVALLEEALDQDRTALQKVNKSVKAIYNSGQDHVQNAENYAQVLDKFGSNFLSGDNPDLGTAFVQFSTLTKELSTLLNTLLQGLSQNVIFTLDSLLNGDLKGVQGDLKKPFDKAWKDYETKFTKLEKEKREHAKQHGMMRTEITGAEIAEQTEKERRLFQLQMCEYLLQVNNIKTKKGVDLLQNLIKYYHAQCNFFQDGLKTADKLKQYIENLAADLYNTKETQEEEKNQLTALRDLIKSSLQLDQKEDPQSRQGGYSMHQLQGNKEYGSEKKGNLLKKSDGIRKVWQRRKCAVKDGMLTISRARTNRLPAKLNLLTCQVKPNAKDKKSFDLMSPNRRYQFRAEDKQDYITWISVLTNSKEEALTMAFRGEQSTGENSLEDLTKAIIEDVQRLPGNDVCCDCGSSKPTWLSTNLGILTCIECSGLHREMGVHISRIQSLELDKLGTSELLLAKTIGNNSFNNIMEGNVPSPSPKPTPMSDMSARKEYIMAKYVDHRFSRKTCSSPSAKLKELMEAVRSRDLLALVQVYAEGVELMEPLLEPGQELGETALHLAVRTADQTSLHVVDFLAQNCGNLDKQTAQGNTALHYCSMFQKPECLKLLLRRKLAVDVVNQAGETALDIAKRLKATQCEDLLSQAKSGKFNTRVHVEYNWNLRQEEMDEGEDHLDYKPSPIKKERSPRPQSFCHSSSTSPQDKLVQPGFCTPRDKQRVSYRVFPKQIVTSRSMDSPKSPTSEAPPLPPGNAGKGPPGPPSKLQLSMQSSNSGRGTSTGSKKRPLPQSPGHKRTLSDPPSPLPQGPSKEGAVTWGNDMGPSSTSKTTNKFEELSQQASTGSTKSALGPRVLPKLPQKVALRKPETSHPLSLDQASIPPEGAQKPAPLADLSQKPPGDLPPKPTDLAPRPQIGDLLLKPGELPPKPQLGDLPPKPHMKDLPPKLQLEDLLAKAPPTAPPTAPPRAPPRAPPANCYPKAHSLDLSQNLLAPEALQKQASEDAHHLTPTLPEMSVPLPRKINTGKNKVRRVKTIYDCQADNDDELTFLEGEVIIFTGEEEQAWWIGHIEGEPERKGVFPVSFVQILTD
ncbi:arf-GAP with SH3 domain, ANK repeat and PH domain-containing protein 1-like [Pipistrellus kuhlii]|uniref:arf-GAP with SH3 domain, ANK repeat and PH domain-containing protein 1-like n=1 Tax=Pipistrellus kuhlii TaxID=59472 RepID=UPI00174F6BD0|nr:arf-GAP with SH3 domain, ANK repeat and PH domain-containing protein 1-like [Pipistrellus kuhlii]